jgi:hypothetical protein
MRGGQYRNGMGTKLVYVDDRFSPPKQHCACLMVRPVSRFGVVAFRARVFQERHGGLNKLTSTTVLPVQIQASIKSTLSSKSRLLSTMAVPFHRSQVLAVGKFWTIARRAKIARANYTRRARAIFDQGSPRTLDQGSHQSAGGE